MNTQKILIQLQENPSEIEFNHVMQAIENDYDFIETSFKNGMQQNSEGENSGSCKIFSFAIINQLDKEQTLSLFGQYYQDVLKTPKGTDHQNIREFIKNGFAGLSLSQNALTLKKER